MIFWTSESLQVVFSIMSFSEYIFPSRVTTSFCILPSSQLSLKLCHTSNFRTLPPYSKNPRSKNCHVSCFHFKKKQQKTTNVKKKSVRLFLRLHEMARSERRQASPPWISYSPWSWQGHSHHPPKKVYLGGSSQDL